MQIKQLATKPKLIEVALDQEELVKEYGEPVTFWMKDHVDINTYFDFYRSQTEKEGDGVNQVLRKMILNAEGETVLADDEALPIDIALAAITKIGEVLGKSRTKSLTPSAGTQQG